MSAVAKAHPGDRTASVLSDDEAAGDGGGTAKQDLSASAREVEDAKNSWAIYGSGSADHGEIDSEMPKPSYTFDWSLKIRDYGFLPSDPRHYGKPYSRSPGGGGGGEPPKSATTAAAAAAEDDDANDNYSARYSGQATALYDFEAENPSELSFREGQVMTILFRQCAGWLVAQMDVEGGGGGGGGEEEEEEERDAPEGDAGRRGGGEEGEETPEDGDADVVRKTLRTRKGLVPQNYVQIWGSST